jgi:hypothetical protein
MEKIEKWLLDNKDLIKIKSVEREIGCPPTTLQKVAQGKMAFPDKWREPLKKWAKRFIRPIVAELS